MPRMRTLLALTSALVLSLFVACGSDDDVAGAPTLAPTARPTSEPQTTSDAALTAYFGQIESAKAAHDQQLPTPLTVGESADAPGAARPPGASDANMIEFLIDVLTQDNTAVTGLLAALDGLDVPLEVASEHGEVVRTLTARFDFQQELIAQFQTGERETSEQIDRREGDLRATGGALCVIQAEASHYGVEIDLGCDIEDVLKLRRTDRANAGLTIGGTACDDPRGEHTQLSTFVDFINTGDVAFRLYRVDEDGEREFALTLEPGQEHLQVTYVGVAWVVTDLDGRCLGAYVSRAEGTNVPINAADIP